MFGDEAAAFLGWLQRESALSHDSIEAVDDEQNRSERPGRYLKLYSDMR